MKQNTRIPSVVEKFREQRQRMIKLLIAFVVLIIVGAGVPLGLGFSVPDVQNNPALKTIGLAWSCAVGILFIVLAIAAFITQRCPVCGTAVGEESWTAWYCSNCGTKLSDN